MLNSINQTVPVEKETHTAKKKDCTIAYSSINQTVYYEINERLCIIMRQKKQKKQKKNLGHQDMTN